MTPLPSLPLLMVLALIPAAAATGADNDAARPTAPAKERSVSPGVAAALAVGMPKYNPPKPVEKTPEEDVDLREVDKPKNTIIRLPKYIVQEPKPPVFREREIHTDKGLGELALKRYFSETGRALNRYTIPLFGQSAEARALAMYAEDERLENISELKEDAAMVRKADPAGSAYILRETDKTFMRSSDFGRSPSR